MHPPSKREPVAQPASHWQVYKRLLAYLKPLKWLFALAVLGNILYAAGATAMAAAMETVIKTIETPTHSNRILLTAMIVGVFLLRGTGTFMGNYFISRVGRNLVMLLRRDLFNHMLKLPNRYFDQSASGHLVSRITFNVDQVMRAATNSVTITLREGLTVLGLFGLMIVINWKLTLIFLSLGPVIGLLIGYVSKRFRHLSRRIQSSMGDLTQVTSETVSGYRVMRSFGGEAYERARFDAVSQNNLKQALKMALTQALSTPVVQILIAIAMAILVWVMLSPEIRGGMTTGALVTFITAASTIAKPARQLTSVHAEIQKGIAAAGDVFEMLDTPVEQDLGQLAPARVRGDIRFDQVRFRYQDQLDEVLKGISVDIKAGTTVALVGRSGSGKSTLVNLLPRFYEITGGQVTIDGSPIGDFTLTALRQQIALVSQQVVLFKDTVANNIAYGDLRGHSLAEITAAAEKAHAMEFIERLPQGLQTQIGDNGVMLSGGQRQRLAIARALLKDAPILILDEATSALDAESERHIQEALEAVMQGRTTLVIAHRLSTIEKADLILVMADGQLIESGTHHELLARQGSYAQLYRTQFGD